MSVHGDVQTGGSADHVCLPFSDQFDGPEPPGWPVTLKLPQRALRGGGSRAEWEQTSPLGTGGGDARRGGRGQ